VPRPGFAQFITFRRR